MSACFYNSIGVMFGLDWHDYLVAGPGPLAVIGIPAKAGYVTAVTPFGIWPGTFYKDTDTVSSDGWDMIQGGYDWYLVPHIPAIVPGPPAVAELAVMGKVLAMSSSLAEMSVHSVTGEGAPLATCLYGPVGLNVNCWLDGLSLPTGAVVNPNSVVTQPTAGDYAGAAAACAVSNAMSLLPGPLPGAIGKHIWRRLPDLFPFLNVPAQVKRIVQRAVDGEP